MSSNFYPVVGGAALHTVGILHYALPPFAAVYYFASVAIGAVRGKLQEGGSQVQETNKPKEDKGLMTVKLWSMTTVLITYVVDSTALLHLSFAGEAAVRQDIIVFALSSVLHWFALLLAYSEPRTSSWHSLAACSVMYLLAETFFLFARPFAQPGRPLTSVLSTVQVFRLFIIIFLLIILLLSRIIPAKRKRSDEEAPLLSDGGSQDNNHCPGDGNCHNYGTMNGGESEDEESDTDEEESYYWGDFGMITFLLPFFWPKNRPSLQVLYVGVGFCLLIDRALNVLVPLQLGRVVNSLSTNPGMFPWKDVILFIILRFLDSSGGVSAVRKYLWLPLENYSYVQISTAAFDKIMTLSSDFHDNERSGNLWESVNRGLSVRYTFRTILFQIVPMVFDLILAVSVLYYVFDVYMALIIAAVVIVFLWSSSKILAEEKDKRRQLIADMDREQSILRESTSNWRNALYFNRIPYEMTRYRAAVANRMSSSFFFLLWSNFESVAQSFLLIFGLLCACLLAAYQVASGKTPVGSFVMLLSYWAQLSSPLQYFASGICDVALHIVNAGELVTLMKKKPTVVDRDGARPLTINRGMVQVKGVDFTYNGRRQVLKKVSFQILPGQTVALVGETGGGKSTILKLILRLYDPVHGIVTIDGQNISNVILESLRANIGVVPQDPILLNDTILNNIRYAKASASEEQVYEVCRAVGLHQKFNAFADGYQTLIGEGGVKLSAGEVRRIAIARAMVKDPKIILLDEATRDVDVSTETQVQESLENLCRGRTTLVIAHRLSTVVNADKILVIRDGKVVEQGSHNSLLQANGYYSRLWACQTAVESLAPMVTSAGTRTQQKAVRRSNGEALAQNLKGLTVTNELRDLSGVASTDVTKSHYKKTYRLVVSPGEDGLQEAHSANTIIGGESSKANDIRSKKGVWKPDVPEFVPSSQRSTLMKSQTVMEHRTIGSQSMGASKHHSGHGGVDKGNSQRAREVIDNGGAARFTRGNENARITIATAQKNNQSKGNDSREFPSIFERNTNVCGSSTTTTTAGSSNQTFMKARKPKKRQNLRRELTRSEPAGIGLTSM